MRLRLMIRYWLFTLTTGFSGLNAATHGLNKTLTVETVHPIPVDEKNIKAIKVYCNMYFPMKFMVQI